jgi:Tol biopolymer transport system component
MENQVKNFSLVGIFIIFVMSSTCGKIQDQTAEIKTELAGIEATKTDFGMEEPFDLSPDGKKMVGVQISGKGQNIIVSDLETGQRNNITNFEYSDEYYETYNPSWSPDGKEIAYLSSLSSQEGKSDNQLCVSSLEGQTRIVIRSVVDRYTPYAWMPDGRSILTIKRDENNRQELGLVPSNGGGFNKLIGLKGRVLRYHGTRPTACVSPDGRFICYMDLPTGEESELFIMTAEGKTPWPLAPSPAMDQMPRWSPNGKHIIFLSNRDGTWALWGVSVKEGRPGSPFLIQEGMGDNIFGNWTIHGLVSWNFTRARDIYLLDADPATGKPRGNFRQLDYLPEGSKNHPRYAPVGSSLAFIRTDTSANKRYLVVHQGEKGNVQEYEFPERRAPRTIHWMPDRSGIIVICGLIHLKLSFDTGTWETYPPSAHGEAGSRTPVGLAEDGKSIRFGKNGLFEDGAGIIKRNLETGEERYVFRPEEGASLYFWSPSWSRDFKKIVFRDTDDKLTVVDFGTGTSQVLLSRSPGLLAWSPDGMRIMKNGPVDQEKTGTFISVFSLADGSVEEYDLVDLIDNMPNGNVGLADWSADGKELAFQQIQNISEHIIYTNIIPENQK